MSPTTLTHHEAPVRAPRNLVERYALRFPWYGRLLDSLGVRHSDRLADLPLMDQATLEHHYYSSDDQPPGTHAFFTSGTSGGRRKRILYGVEDENAYVAQRRALFERFTRGIPAGSTAVADLGTGHAAASARRIFAEMGFTAHDIDFRAPLREHVAKLNRWRPDVLFTMPMILDHLMRSPEPLRISPRKIMVVGDLAPAAWRANAARHFGLRPDDVMDVFGSIEIGAIAHTDPDTGLYHFHDHIIAEVVPPHLLLPDLPERDLPPGDGVLLLTSLTRPNFPALRYVTGDLVSGLRVIEHRGRPVTVFDRIEGRLTGDFKHGERVSSHDLCEAAALVFPGRAFEVVDDGGLRVRVVADHVTPEQVRAFRAAVDAAAPDVATMVASGLVRPIEVEAIRAEDLRSGGAKRRFHLKES